MNAAAKEEMSLQPEDILAQFKAREFAALRFAEMMRAKPLQGKLLWETHKNLIKERSNVWGLAYSIGMTLATYEKDADRFAILPFPLWYKETKPDHSWDQACDFFRECQQSYQDEIQSFNEIEYDMVTKLVTARQVALGPSFRSYIEYFQTLRLHVQNQIREILVQNDLLARDKSEALLHYITSLKDVLMTEGYFSYAQTAIQLQNLPMVLAGEVMLAQPLLNANHPEQMMEDIDPVYQKIIAVMGISEGEINWLSMIHEARMQDAANQDETHTAEKAVLLGMLMDNAEAMTPAMLQDPQIQEIFAVLRDDPRVIEGIKKLRGATSSDEKNFSPDKT